MALKTLIARVQTAIANGGMTKEVVDSAIKELSNLGYAYDDGTFPPLTDTETFTDTSRDIPVNLAEALLWKLGKWKVYKKFAANYGSEDSEATKTDVVLFAFARHLKNKDNPIYDQHAMRALWVICGEFTDDENEKCKSLPFDGKRKWKAVASGGDTIECYELFRRHLDNLVNVESGPTKGRLDRLLMPLGQAIKKSTDSYEEFCQLCGWERDG
jgi:hypothetical protein